MAAFVGGFAAPVASTQVNGARLFSASKNVACFTARLRRVHASRGTVSMHGPSANASSSSSSAAAAERRPGSHKGFVEEMRFVAMRLHTKDQAPREGQMEEAALPIQEWRPRKEDYLQFLVDSKAVYDFMEARMADADAAWLHEFTSTGLERGAALDKDIQWFRMLDFDVPPPTPAATKYIAYLQELVRDKPNAFLCHWYNYYFAHSAGGRMIGRMMSNLLFEGKEFEFYAWEKDVKEILGEVREKIDRVASDWPRDVKDECLNETSLAFAYSGTVLSNLAKAS
ncbi:Heme oxygenase 1, chloroplastic [Porphyridium purpureum]|uniref:Heme oxygenase 1, chloroplastic n=1 Tax=Porphyridium purpureum TaxID=35688 RepID=A0A5J4YWV0_PORPP|nr:Heme oxygenase 1, chloroplastic [Porphyridium purpureum]|eukprot:POR3745..scf227_4